MTILHAIAAPGYWMNETSGVLKPVVQRYLAGAPMDATHIGIMRAYLRQWVFGPGFHGWEVDRLRESLNEIQDRDDLEAWLDGALEAGVDPL